MEPTYPQLPNPPRLLPPKKKASIQRDVYASHIYSFSHSARIHSCWNLFSRKLYCIHLDDGQCPRYDSIASIEKVYFGQHKQSFVLALLHNSCTAIRNSVLLLPNEGETSTS